MDEFERTRKAKKDKRTQRALAETIGASCRNNCVSHLKAQKAISRWESALDRMTTIKQTQSPGVDSPLSTTPSSMSPPVQPIRLLSPQKKSRAISQTLCQDLTTMLTAVTQEACQNETIQFASPNRASPRKHRRSFSLQKGLQQSLALNLLKADRNNNVLESPAEIIGESSEQIMTTYSTMDSALAFFSPVKKRTALRLPTDSVLGDVRDMMNRASPSGGNQSSNTPLVSWELTSDDECSVDADDVDSLYDIESCSDHSFEDEYPHYDDFSVTSYDESCSEDASLASVRLQPSLEVRP